MRISGGSLKGRKFVSQKAFLKQNEKDELRPTSSKVREALFDILRNDIENASFLDLYAGTGTVGFEAISRGAANVCFIENNQVRFSMIDDSINKVGLDDKAHVFREQALAFLKRASRTGISFEIIFADPPYSSEEMDQVVALIDENEVLKTGGCLVLEHSSRRDLQYTAGHLRFVKNYRYGDTMLTLFRKEQ